MVLKWRGIGECEFNMGCYTLNPKCLVLEYSGNQCMNE
jgi:hypothetical protein